MSIKDFLNAKSKEFIKPLTPYSATKIEQEDSLEEWKASMI
jgi:hypothetical protein